jgi:signal transduction histidine kinase
LQLRLQPFCAVTAAQADAPEIGHLGNWFHDSPRQANAGLAAYLWRQYPPVTAMVRSMRACGSKIRWWSVARALVAAFALSFTPVPLQAAEQEARVLMLYGLDPYLPPFLAMDKAMRQSLASADRRINFFSESLDSQRFAMEKLEPEMATLLAAKYRGLPIDVVVAVSQTALDFFERHGAQIWPGARVVFVGFLGYESKPSALPPGALAVLSTLDVAGTIEIARRLQPDPQRIVMISGMSEVDRRTEAQAREEFAKLREQRIVEYLSGLPLVELEARVAEVPPDSVVIFLAQFRDREGRPYEPHDVLRAVVKASRSPVYGAAETFIGLGAVAGSVASYESRGRLIGEQVRRTLAGGPVDPSHTVLAAPNHCVADARALLRWSLDTARLPSNCEIRFANVPIWRHYWWQIGLTLAIVAAQAALIVALLSQRRRRLLAEQAEQAQRTELARTARRATAGELTGAIAHEVNQPLGAILTNVDTAELMLDSGRDRREELRAILANIRRDDLRASEVIQHLRELLGNQKFERREFDFNGVVDDLEAIMRAEARRRGVTLEIQRAPEGLAIMGDRIQIQQVLINLVLNAMDAVAEQPEARRRVVVSVGKSDKGALLTVQDRGHGVAPEHRTKLFESFFSTKRNGMGLGLSITRTIVEAHGGRIWVDTAPEMGTVFQAEIPLANANGVSSPNPA